RSVVVLLPLLLARQGRSASPRPLLIAASLLALAIALVPLRSEYAWGAMLRRPDAGMRSILSNAAFQPDATYRILRAADGNLRMYQTIQAGSRIDSEFFPESIDRRSWPNAAAYTAFLHRRGVDYVIVFRSYDERFRTNEHGILNTLVGICGTPVLTP